MERARSSVWPLVILALMIAVAVCARGAFATVQEAAKHDLGLDDLRLGLVQGLALSVPIAALSIPLGRAVDRYNRVRIMLAMALIWSVGSIVTAYAPNFTILFLARMAAGLGSTCGLPAAISIAADLCPAARRGRAMLYLTLGQWAGSAIGFAACGALFGLFTHGGTAWMTLGLAPWRAVHLVVGVVSLVLTFLLFAVREPARHELGAGDHAGLGVVLGELWARRAFLAPLFVGQLGVVMADVAAGIWVPAVLTRDYHLAPDQFGGWVGGVIFAGGVLGSIAGGLLADRGQRGARRGGILVGASVAAAVAVPAAFFPIMPGVAWFGAMLFLLILAGTLAGLVTATALTVLLPNEVRGVCLGTFIAVAGVIGFGVSPTLVTAVGSLLGGPAHLGEALAFVGAAVGIVSTAGFVFAIRNAPAI